MGMREERAKIAEDKKSKEKIKAERKALELELLFNIYMKTGKVKT